MGRTLADDTAALARLEALDRQVTELADRLGGPGADGKDGHRPSPAPAWWTLTPAERKPAIAELRAWVDQVYRPGYGHLAATLGPCWPAHDLCLYGLDIAQPAVAGAVPPARPQHQPALGPGGIPGPHPARSGRPADDRNHRLRPRPGPRIHPEGPVTNPVLRQALHYAERGWPVFPCLPGQKIPATRHGFLDATTDPQRITEWFGRQGGWNLAIATGAPGPDVLDVDQHGPAGNGFSAFARLRAAGLLEGASGYVRTPSGGLHAYFTGSAQRNGHLPAQHLDFRSAGGYVLAPPSQVRGRPYQRIRTLDGHGGLDWQAVIRLLEPEPPVPAASHPPAARLRDHPPGPLGRRPARRQPQRRPVLGRQPRPGRRPGRRPQRTGRRRPPGRAPRTRDHPHPELRPPHPARHPQRPRPPGRRSQLT